MRAGDLRYVGQGYELKMPFPDGVDRRRRSLTEIWRRFHEAHKREYGHVFADSPIEIVNIRVVGVGQHAEDRQADRAGGRDAWRRRGSGPANACSASTASCAPSRRRSTAAHLLPVGEAFAGPAIILQKDTTTVVPPGCTAINDAAGNLILKVAGDGAMNDSDRSNRRPQPPTRVDPITGAVIQGALENIAIEMGHKLMRMSYSSIIRESEDFGAALTDAEGRQLCECKMSTPLQSGPIPGYIRGIRKALRSPRRRVPSRRRHHAQRSLWRRLARPGRGVLRAGLRRRRSDRLFGHHRASSRYRRAHAGKLRHRRCGRHLCRGIAVQGNQGHRPGQAQRGGLADRARQHPHPRSGRRRHERADRRCADRRAALSRSRPPLWPRHRERRLRRPDGLFRTA